MERLTQKHDFFEYVLPCQDLAGETQAAEIKIGDTEYAAKKYMYGEAIREFGKLEDVLEKYEIENLDDFIKEYSSRNIKLANDNYGLEQELAELKQKAIVPKYQVGQVLFRIDFGSVVPFIVNDIYVHIKADKTVSVLYFDYSRFVAEQNELFATREQAEKELKGE